MGFNFSHTISAVSKLALQAKRKSDHHHTSDNESNFQMICQEFNNNKLISKFEGYIQNKNFKVGLNGNTIFIYNHEENELARFQDVPHMYRGKFIPNTNILVVKSTSGYLLFYDLDKLELMKKFKFSNIKSQDENFDITQDGKYLYNIEAPKSSTRTQLTKYDLKTLKPIMTSFYDLDKLFLKYVEIDSDNIYLFGFIRDNKGVKNYGFIGLYKEMGEKCGIQGVKKLDEDVYSRVYQYKVCEDYGFTQKSLKYRHLEKNRRFRRDNFKKGLSAD